MDEVVCGVPVNHSNNKEARNKPEYNEALRCPEHALSIVNAEQARSGENSRQQYFPTTRWHYCGNCSFPDDVVAA
jgi:hypothetical protein